MKLLVLLLAAIFQGQQAPQTTDPTKTLYQNLWVGMKFEYPKEWQISTNKKGESRFLIPVEGTSERAVLEITSVTFRSDPVVWQLSQVGMNKSLKRTIDRQWEEEILGVPLLLTQTSYEEKGAQLRSVSGLIYTLGFNKLLYRLTSSQQAFEKTDYQWRQVLQSLRTWDGSMPTKEDPNVKIEAKDPKKDELPHPTTPHEVGAPAKVKVVKAPLATTIDFANRKIGLHVPGSWKVEPGEGNAVTLKHAALDGGVNVRIMVAGESTNAESELLRASGVSLGDFVSVSSRDENSPRTNLAGATVVEIWRSGKTSKGDLFTCEAYGQSEDVYFLLTWRTDHKERFGAEAKAIRELIEQMSVEVSP